VIGGEERLGRGWGRRERGLTCLRFLANFSAVFAPSDKSQMRRVVSTIAYPFPYFRVKLSLKN